MRGDLRDFQVQLTKTCNVSDVMEQWQWRLGAQMMAELTMVRARCSLEKLGWETHSSFNTDLHILSQPLHSTLISYTTTLALRPRNKARHTKSEQVQRDRCHACDGSAGITDLLSMQYHIVRAHIVQVLLWTTCTDDYSTTLTPKILASAQSPRSIYCMPQDSF